MQWLEEDVKQLRVKQTQCEEKAADQQLQRQVRQEVLKLRRQTGATYREGTEQQHTCKWRSHNLGVLLCLAHLEKQSEKISEKLFVLVKEPRHFSFRCQVFTCRWRLFPECHAGDIM